MTLSINYSVLRCVCVGGWVGVGVNPSCSDLVCFFGSYEIHLKCESLLNQNYFIASHDYKF